MKKKQNTRFEEPQKKECILCNYQRIALQLYTELKLETLKVGQGRESYSHYEYQTKIPSMRNCYTCCLLGYDTFESKNCYIETEGIKRVKFVQTWSMINSSVVF